MIETSVRSVTANQGKNGGQDVAGATLLSADPSRLTFTANVVDQVLTLRNNSSELTVAFKMRTSEPKYFRVKPATGLIPPKGVVKVAVTFKTEGNAEPLLNAAVRFQVRHVFLTSVEAAMPLDTKHELWEAPWVKQRAKRLLIEVDATSSPSPRAKRQHESQPKHPSPIASTSPTRSSVEGVPPLHLRDLLVKNASKGGGAALSGEEIALLRETRNSLVPEEWQRWLLWAQAERRRRRPQTSISGGKSTASSEANMSVFTPLGTTPTAAASNIVQAESGRWASISPRYALFKAATQSVAPRATASISTTIPGSTRRGGDNRVIAAHNNGAESRGIEALRKSSEHPSRENKPKSAYIEAAHKVIDIVDNTDERLRPSELQAKSSSRASSAGQVQHALDNNGSPPTYNAHGLSSATAALSEILLALESSTRRRTPADVMKLCASAIVVTQTAMKTLEDTARANDAHAARVLEKAKKVAACTIGVRSSVTGLRIDLKECFDGVRSDLERLKGVVLASGKRRRHQPEKPSKDTSSLFHIWCNLVHSPNSSSPRLNNEAVRVSVSHAAETGVKFVSLESPKGQLAFQFEAVLQGPLSGCGKRAMDAALPLVRSWLSSSTPAPSILTFISLGGGRGALVPRGAVFSGASPLDRGLISHLLESVFSTPSRQMTVSAYHLLGESATNVLSDSASGHVVATSLADWERVAAAITTRTALLADRYGGRDTAREVAVSHPHSMTILRLGLQVEDEPNSGVRKVLYFIEMPSLDPPSQSALSLADRDTYEAHTSSISLRHYMESLLRIKKSHSHPLSSILLEDKVDQLPLPPPVLSDRKVPVMSWLSEALGKLSNVVLIASIGNGSAQRVRDDAEATLLFTEALDNGIGGLDDEGYKPFPPPPPSMTPAQFTSMNGYDYEDAAYSNGHSIAAPSPAISTSRPRERLILTGTLSGTPRQIATASRSGASTKRQLMIQTSPQRSAASSPGRGIADTSRSRNGVGDKLASTASSRSSGPQFHFGSAKRVGHQ